MIFLAAAPSIEGVVLGAGAERVDGDTYLLTDQGRYPYEFSTSNPSLLCPVLTTRDLT